jgi:2-polyprenyl-6-methoxyphenol hydroxylase-like FAD-dependent oxidoreductase
VTLLERQTDFAREFRGEALMPSGVDAFAQMGLPRRVAASTPGQIHFAKDEDGEIAPHLFEESCA